MKNVTMICALYLVSACLSAHAQSAQNKPADEISGCVERQIAEKYISEHNYAELLRGEGSDGKTYAVWTNGVQVLVVNYLRPAEQKIDELKTICVSGLASKVTFNFEVIEKLVKAAAGSVKK